MFSRANSPLVCYPATKIMHGKGRFYKAGLEHNCFYFNYLWRDHRKCLPGQPVERENILHPKCSLLLHYSRGGK